MYLLGGGTYETPAVPERIFKNDVWSSADGVEWVMECAEAPWRKRQMHDTAVFDGKLWVMVRRPHFFLFPNLHSTSSRYLWAGALFSVGTQPGVVWAGWFLRPGRRARRPGRGRER